MIRFFYMVYGLPSGWSTWVVPIGLTTAFVGVFLALFQMDGKRLIAMSTVSQVGLIVVALGSATVLGAVGGAFHLISHSVFKSLLFLSAGWAMWTAGTRDLRAVRDGVGQSRLIFLVYLVGLLSISGIPPLSGFFGKSLVAKSIADEFPYLALLSTTVGMLTLLSFMKLGWYLFLGKREGRAVRPPVPVMAVCASLAVLCVGMGLMAPTLLGVLDRALGTEAGAETTPPSIMGSSILTTAGYLAAIAALVVWSQKGIVYRLLTRGRLQPVGRLAERELYFDHFYAGVASGTTQVSALLRRTASGNARDYMSYVIIAWLAVLVLILGGAI
jgi:formate hydrogenlyase subunit 3/multisubunit Na+/H+ antiporter MnhD subunit